MRPLRRITALGTAGLIVLLCATPAPAADTPGLIESAAEVVPASTRVDDATAPVTKPAEDAVATVAQPAEDVATPVAAEVAAPVAKRADATAAPVTTQAAEVAAPVAKRVDATAAPAAQRVAETAAPVAKRVDATAAPVTQRVVDTAAPVVKRVDATAAPVVKRVDATAAPVTTAAAPVVDAVAATVAPAAKRVDAIVAPVSKHVDAAVAPASKRVDDRVALASRDDGASATETSSPSDSPATPLTLGSSDAPRSSGSTRPRAAAAAMKGGVDSLDDPGESSAISDLGLGSPEAGTRDGGVEDGLRVAAAAEPTASFGLKHPPAATPPVIAAVAGLHSLRPIGHGGTNLAAPDQTAAWLRDPDRRRAAFPLSAPGAKRSQSAMTRRNPEYGTRGSGEPRPGAPYGATGSSAAAAASVPPPSAVSALLFAALGLAAIAYAVLLTAPGRMRPVPFISLLERPG